MKETKYQEKLIPGESDKEFSIGDTCFHKRGNVKAVYLRESLYTNIILKQLVRSKTLLTEKKYNFSHLDYVHILIK